MIRHIFGKLLKFLMKSDPLQPDGCNLFVLLIFLCKGKASNFFYLHCYSHQVKMQFYHINGVRVLTVKSAAIGNRVQFSVLGDRGLSKHLHNFVFYVFYFMFVTTRVNDTKCLQPDGCKLSFLLTFSRLSYQVSCPED